MYVMTGQKVITTIILLSLEKGLKHLFVFYLENLKNKSSPKLGLNLSTLCSQILDKKQINALIR